MARFLLIDTTGETVENGARRQVEADSAQAAVEQIASSLPVRPYEFTVVSLDTGVRLAVTPDVTVTVAEVVDPPPVEVPADPAPADPTDVPVEDPPADPVV